MNAIDYSTLAAPLRSALRLADGKPAALAASIAEAQLAVYFKVEETLARILMRGGVAPDQALESAFRFVERVLATERATRATARAS